jgi:hypothetical protein
MVFSRFLLFQQGRLITYFPHYPCIRFCLLNFTGKRGYLVENKGFLCLLIFACMLDEGYLEDKSVPYVLITSDWRAVPHRKSSAQLWTVSDDTVPYTFKQSLCQLLFPIILNISTVGENSV